ncbi:MAG: riboflavin biosynthesis protein RibF [Planctomycetota bacterium]
MRIHAPHDQLRPQLFRSPVATLGVFDGVHRGHQHLIAELVAWRKALGDSESVVITFREHPMAVLGHLPPAMLTSLEHRLVLLDRLGVDAAVVLNFDRTLAELPAEDFTKRVIRDAIGCRHLLMGFDAAFGHGAKGTAEFLQGLPSLGVEVRRSSPYLLEGLPVSSTEVRKAVLKGQLEVAARLLGRSVSIFGEVIHGDGRGRSLGFPTANLNLFHSAAPPHGVYLARIQVAGTSFGGLVNIGRRPTFMRPDDPEDYSRYFNEQLDKIEVYVHKYSGDLYGQRIEAVLHGKLRDERRFENSTALVTQIRKDVAQLEAWLAGAGG